MVPARLPTHTTASRRLTSQSSRATVDNINETLLTGTNENSKPFMPDEKDNTNNDDVVSVLPITPLFGKRAARFR